MSWQKKLKASKSFKWSFVNADEATKGVKNEKYYMALFVPRDFSAQSTQLLQNQKKLPLRVLTNQSRDYVADIITTSGASKIAERLNQEITQKYLEVIAEKLAGFKDKLSLAADGAGKLLQGNQSLNAGLNKLADGIDKLGAGEKTMRSKVADGRGQFTRLSSGLDTLHSKLFLFSSGANQLQAGIAQAQAGASELNARSGDVTSGLQQLSGGLTTLDTKLAEVVRAANDPHNAAKLKALQDGSSSVADALKALAQGSGALSGGLAQMNAQLPSAAELAAAKKALQSGSKLNMSFSEKMSLVRALKSDSRSRNGNYDAALTKLDAFNKLSAEDRQKILSTIYDVQDENVSGLIGTMQRLTSRALKEKSKTAKEKATQLVDGLIKVRAALDAGLYAGSDQLNAGLTQLDARYGQLDAGIAQLVNTTTQSQNSLTALAAGVNKLNAGSTRLKDGFSRYAAGVGALEGGLNQLGAGSEKLANGSDLLRAGAGAAAQGAGRFQHEFFSKLSSGIGALQDGTSKLADGSQQLVDGDKQLDQGLQTLQTGLFDGAQKLAQAGITPAVAELLSNPLELTKQTSKAGVFGVSSLAYQVPLGLYLAAFVLMIAFPGGVWMSRLGVGSGSAGKNHADNDTATERASILSIITNLVVYSVVATLMTGVGLIVLLSIRPADMFGFFTMLLCTSLSYTFFVAACNALFGKLGKFVILLLFIVQLAVAGGTFPIETTNPTYEFLNALMPLTYIMKGLTWCLFGNTLSSHLVAAFVYTIGLLAISAFALFAHGAVSRESNSGSNSSSNVGTHSDSSPRNKAVDTFGRTSDNKLIGTY